MDKFEKLLSIGDLRSAGKSAEVIKRVINKPELFSSIVDCIFSDNPATRMRASDVVEKLTIEHPEWLKPYKKLFLSKIAETEQKEVRWHVAQILPRFKLTAKEREKVFNIMLGYLEDKSQIVKTFAMQALTDIATQDVTYVKRVRPIVVNLMKHGAPSQQSRGKKLLKILDNL